MGKTISAYIDDNELIEWVEEAPENHREFRSVSDVVQQSLEMLREEKREEVD